MSYTQSLSRGERGLTPAVLAISAGTLAGLSVAGGRLPVGLCLLISVVLGGSAVLHRRFVALPHGFVLVELPILLLVVEVYESRPRSSDQLAAAPLAESGKAH